MAKRLSQQIIARTAVTRMIHEGVNEADEWDAGADGVPYRGHALSAIPAVHAFV
jgi:hypothetical protein